MTASSLRIAAVLALAGAAASALPPDVPSSNWAAPAVTEVLKNGVMSLPDGRKFHGQETVSHAQAAIALSSFAKAIQSEKWRSQRSVPVTKNTLHVLKNTAWKSQPVTRFALANVLARAGDYLTNGLTRAARTGPNRGQSVVLAAVHPTVRSGGAAHAALSYLAANHMLAPDSPLLSGDNAPIKAAELSSAMTLVIASLTDKLTPMGHDAEGNTLDKSFHRPPGSSRG